MTELELAQALGVSRSTVRKRIKAGMPKSSAAAAKSWSTANVPDVRTLTDHRKRLTELKAKALEMKVRREGRQLIDIDVHKAIYHGTIRPIVSALRGIPRKVAPMLAREPDPSKCEQIVLDALHEVLNAVSTPAAIDQMLERAGVPEDLGQSNLH